MPATPPISPLGFWHPVNLLATWFGSGLLPKVPGTWGSLAALPFAIVIVDLAGTWGLLAAAILATLVGVWATAIYAARLYSESKRKLDTMQGCIDLMRPTPPTANPSR